MMSLSIEGFEVDHKDGDTLNNTRSNIRVATRSLNSANRKKLRKNTSSRYRGVSYYRQTNKWEAYSRGPDGKKVRAGYFDSEKEAAIAYNKLAESLFGEFANLNEV